MRISGLKEPNKQAKRRGCLKWSQNPSEFEIQSFLYWSLKEMGYVVRGEVSTHGMKSRFDIAIYPRVIEKIPVRIIEVKAQKGAGNINGSKAFLQRERYETDYGIPTDIVAGIKDAKRYLKIVSGLIGTPDSLK